MFICDTLIRNARIVTGDGVEASNGNSLSNLAILNGSIVDIGSCLEVEAHSTVDAEGQVLCPAFIDTHTHDDLAVIRDPVMLSKLSQGVATVIVGNCGISAVPARVAHRLPDPMNLLGPPEAFRYPDFSSYVSAVENAQPSVNVASLIGHTTLRNNCMSDLNCAATSDQLSTMHLQLQECLRQGAIGLSTGLAYLSAAAATTAEVLYLADALEECQGIYATHLRSETEQIIPAMEEAFDVGRRSHASVVVSHLKCAGIQNWGRGEEVLGFLNAARKRQPITADCYPYAAGSSTLDLRQIEERVRIVITWSDSYPEMAGKTLEEISSLWMVTQLEAARRLQPAGAIYHSIDEGDMRRFLQDPETMIGSDGLPNDLRPHPRLWGTFPRVLGKYCREEKLFTLSSAIHKMTGLPAEKFRLQRRGIVKIGNYADLVLFNPDLILDTATFEHPVSAAVGIIAVWVNGVLSYCDGKATGRRAGKYLVRAKRES